MPTHGEHRASLHGVAYVKIPSISGRFTIEHGSKGIALIDTRDEIPVRHILAPVIIERVHQLVGLSGPQYRVIARGLAPPSLISCFGDVRGIALSIASFCRLKGERISELERALEVLLPRLVEER